MAKRRNRWTPEEIQEIFSKPFEIFPEPSPEAKAKGRTKRGPLEWQKYCFPWMFPWEKRLKGEGTLHCHPQDNLLVYSGAGTAKTTGGVALNLFFMATFPGCQTLVIAEVYSDVEQIVIPKFKELLSINEPWDHPALVHVPNKQDKFLDLKFPVVDEDGNIKEWKISRCWFGHAADFERLRGKEYVYIHAEEISQFKDERVLDEFSRRLRSSVSPFRMLYATTNPPESMSHFLYQKWDLTERMPNFEGEKPQPRLCSCQWCPECQNDGQNFGYGKDDYCLNKDCSFKKTCLREGIPPTRFKKPTWDFNGKTYSCPGNQTFWRVLTPQANENIHNPSSLNQELKAGHDEASYAVYVHGEARALRSNKVYPAFSFQANSYQPSSSEVETDFDKDIIWSHDYNKRPRCSVVVQEHPEGDEVFVRVIDEIVLYDTEELKFNPEDGSRIRGVGPEHAAEKFIERYKNWNQQGILAGNQKTVYIHGDHTSLNNKMSPFSKNEFQVMYDMLVEAGFKVIVAVRKIPGKMQISQADRIALTNWLLRDNKAINRIKINKVRCKHLLKSLEDLETKTNDREEIKKDCDETARKTTNTKVVHLISHVSDALGYYLVRCFNLVQEGDLIRFIHIEGGSLLNIDKDGKISELPRNYPQVNSEIKKPTKEEIENFYTQEWLDKIRGYLDQEKEQYELEEIDRFRSYFG